MGLSSFCSLLLPDVCLGLWVIPHTNFSIESLTWKWLSDQPLGVPSLQRLWSVWLGHPPSQPPFPGLGLGILRVRDLPNKAHKAFVYPVLFYHCLSGWFIDKCQWPIREIPELKTPKSPLLSESWEYPDFRNSFNYFLRNNSSLPYLLSDWQWVFLL